MSKSRVIVIDDVPPQVPAAHYDLESRRIAAAPLARSMKASRVAMQPSGRADAHVHERAEQLFIVLQGEMGMRVDGEEYRLHPGEALLVQPGELHENFNVFPGVTQYIVVSTPIHA